MPAIPLNPQFGGSLPLGLEQAAQALDLGFGQRQARRNRQFRRGCQSSRRNRRKNAMQFRRVYRVSAGIERSSRDPAGFDGAMNG